MPKMKGVERVRQMYADQLLSDLSKAAWLVPGGPDGADSDAFGLDAVFLQPRVQGAARERQDLCRLLDVAARRVQHVDDMHALGLVERAQGFIGATRRIESTIEP